MLPDLSQQLSAVHQFSIDPITEWTLKGSSLWDNPPRVHYIPVRKGRIQSSPPTLPNSCQRRVQKKQEITVPVSPCAEQAAAQEAQRPLPLLGQPGRLLSLSWFILPRAMRPSWLKSPLCLLFGPPHPWAQLLLSCCRDPQIPR